MINYCSRYWKNIINVIFILAVFVFWRFGFPYMLSYHEQMQMFLWSQDYLMQRLSEPAGGARYIGEFIVQFFNNVTVGSVILTLIYVSIQQNIWKLMQRHYNIKDCFYPFSFIPPVALLCVMEDDCVMMTYVVALLVCLQAMLYIPKKKSWCVCYVVAVIFIGYWFIGPMTVLFVSFASILIIRNSCPVYKGVITAALLCALIFIMIFVSAYFYPYPVERLYKGIDYYRLPVPVSYKELMLVVICCLIVPVTAYIQRAFSGWGDKTIAWLTFIFVVLAVCVITPLGLDNNHCEQLKYDYLLRKQDWNTILATANKVEPQTNICKVVACMSLWKSGNMPDRDLLDIMDNVRGQLDNNISYIMMSDLYFYLGMTSASQRFAFETLQLMPDYNMSGRFLKRLTETNLVNRQYDVARKYARILQRTLFYKEWANHIMQLLDNPELIDADRVYGAMRKMQTKKDILYI